MIKFTETPSQRYVAHGERDEDGIVSYELLVVRQRFDEMPWYWSAWIPSGNSGIEWDGRSPTRDAAEQNAIGALDRLQHMLRERPGV